jgi:uncharacterized membrane protein YtjA (UPF0391 family)
MFRWAIIFLIVAGIAAIFSGIAHEAHIGKFLAVVALILALGSYLLHRRSRSSALSSSPVPERRSPP